MTYTENYRRTPNRSRGTNERLGVVFHHTAGSYAGAVAWLCDPRAQASAHVVIAKDGRRTALAGAIGAADTSLTLTSATGWPSDSATRPVWMQVGSEVIVGYKSGTTISGLIRGAMGTVAAAHASGAAITKLADPFPDWNHVGGPMPLPERVTAILGVPGTMGSHNSAFFEEDGAITEPAGFLTAIGPKELP